jgi:choline dehydrogenase-like flavoprotein
MLKALGDCRACGLCNLGCSFGTKRNARTTYLAWAERLGARVIADAEVMRVGHSRGRVREVEALVGRSRTPLRVGARLFVVCAGAIASSALLLRSGIRQNAGTRFSMNAGAMMVAEFEQALDAFDADQMTVYLRDREWLVECTHNPLMSAALTTPGWFEEHGRLMARTRHLAYAGGMVGSAPVGNVYLSRLTGSEEVSFRLPSSDLEKLKRSLRATAQVFLAAGAKRVILPTHRFASASSMAELERMLSEIVSQSDISMGTAHPQGGNPMAADPKVGVVGADFMVHGFENLAVFDASVFPTAVRVNPIATLLALGKRAAPRILARA